MQKKSYMYKDIDVTNKVNARLDTLINFITRNEELNIEEAFNKIVSMDIYEKITNVDTLYWTIGHASICNEYLQERQ